MLYSKNDLAGIRRIVQKMVALICAYGVISTTILIVFGEQIVSVWSGRNVVYNNIYVFIISAAGAAQIFQILFWSVLVGLNRIRSLMYISLFSTSIFCISLIAIIQYYHELSLPLASALGSLVFSLLAIRYLKGHLGESADIINPNVMTSLALEQEISIHATKDGIPEKKRK
jgi:O-antigen/teichoic acid export membrane protein